jgi:hypothetical protein
MRRLSISAENLDLDQFWSPQNGGWNKLASIAVSSVFSFTWN